MTDDSIEAKVGAIPAMVVQKKLEIVNDLLLDNQKDIYKYCLYLGINPSSIDYTWAPGEDVEAVDVAEQLVEALAANKRLVETRSKLESQ